MENIVKLVLIILAGLGAERKVAGSSVTLNSHSAMDHPCVLRKSTLLVHLHGQKNNSQESLLFCTYSVLTSTPTTSYEFSSSLIELVETLHIKCIGRDSGRRTSGRGSPEDPFNPFDNLFRVSSLILEGCPLRWSKDFKSLKFIKYLNGGSFILRLNETSLPLGIEYVDLSSNLNRGDDDSGGADRATISSSSTTNEIVADTSGHKRHIDLNPLLGCSSHVVSLNLSHNGLTQILNIGKPSCPESLKELDLHNNSLSKLPSGLLTDQLLLLDLSHNSLTTEELYNDGHRKRKQPQRLGARGNPPTTSTSPGIFDPCIRLIVLKLSHNRIESLHPHIFVNLISLQSLHLNDNGINYLPAGVFDSLKNLHTLDLSFNSLTVVDSPVFAQLLVLKELYLDHNRIFKIENQALGNSTRSLTDLGLSFNALDEVPKTIRNLRSLTSLDLGENRIGRVSPEDFYGFSQLYGLRLVDNRIAEVTNDFCRHLNNLRLLNLAQNSITKVASTAFNGCPKLRVLRLDNNLLKTMINMSSGLESLLWLNVSENLIAGKVVSVPRKLEWLDVSHNQISGISLRGFDTLRILDGSNNELEYLNSSVFPTSVEILRLNENRVKSVQDLTFSRNLGLRKVELVGNQIESLSLSSFRVSGASGGQGGAARKETMTKMTPPEFFISRNPFNCDCSMEWMKQADSFRQFHIADLPSVRCEGEQSAILGTHTSQGVKLLDKNQFLCSYSSHCFALCYCCDFDACDCKMECPEGCRCSHNGNWTSNIVACTHSPYPDEDESFPLKIPMDATTIYLDGNHIGVFKPHSFIGKKNVEALYLNASQLVEIQNRTFNGLGALKILHLQDNFLRTLNGYEFIDTTGIEELYLHSNQIRYIHPNTFKILRKLRKLSLHNNQLMSFNVWSWKSVETISLSNNRWTCDCDFLQKFRTWSNTRSYVSDMKSIVCYHDHDLKGASSESAPLLLDAVKTCDFDSSIKKIQLEGSNDVKDSKVVEEMVADRKISEGQGLLDPAVNSHNGPVTPSVLLYNNSLAPQTLQDEGEDFTRSPKANRTSNDPLLIALIVLIALLGVFVILILVVVVRRKKVCSRGHSSSPVCCGGGDSVGPCCRGSKFGGAGAPGTLSATYGLQDSNNKLYDAYFLYSEHDVLLIHEKVVPELERNSHEQNYKLCLHYRDLCAVSPENLCDLMNLASQASRQVVVFLSKNLIQNEWTYFCQSGVMSSGKEKQCGILYVVLPPLTKSLVMGMCKELNVNSRNQHQIIEFKGDREANEFWPMFRHLLSAGSPAHKQKKSFTSPIKTVARAPLFLPQLYPGNRNESSNVMPYYDPSLSLPNVASCACNSPSQKFLFDAATLHHTVQTQQLHVPRNLYCCPGPQHHAPQFQSSPSANNLQCDSPQDTSEHVYSTLENMDADQVQYDDTYLLSQAMTGYPQSSRVTHDPPPPSIPHHPNHSHINSSSSSSGVSSASDNAVVSPNSIRPNDLNTTGASSLGNFHTAGQPSIRRCRQNDPSSSHTNNNNVSTTTMHFVHTLY